MVQGEGRPSDEADAPGRPSQVWSVRSVTPQPRSVSDVRREVRGQLLAWGAEDYEWMVSQLLTEVTTNVVLHARTPFDVTISYRAGTLRCEVSDASRQPPRRRWHSTEATTGRGVNLLEELSDSWGVQERSDGQHRVGKTVWFEVSGAPEERDVPADLAQLMADLDIDVPALSSVQEVTDLGAAPQARSRRRPGDHPPSCSSPVRVGRRQRRGARLRRASADQGRRPPTAGRRLDVLQRATNGG
jgi:hypothetical protein